jgi:stearoyl-CoA desaturase (delta-9 desaturase)
VFATPLTFFSHGVLALPWWQILLTTLALTHVTIISVTVYLHRCQAHRALELHPAVSHFFRFWLWMTTGVTTGPWVAVHRKHHAKCETDADPHSPQIRGIWKVLLGGAELYRAEAKNEETLRKFGHGTPNDWLERNLYARYPDLGVSLLIVMDVALFGCIGVSVWAVQMIWIPFLAGGVVNGVGHFLGYRNFDSADASTNVFPFGILIGGEELHNNHHAYATSARLSNKWYEFDLGWAYICMLSALGLARIRKTSPTPRLVKGKCVLDDDTVQAIIRSRYEVMARYSETAERAYREELERSAHLSRRKRAAQMRAVRKGLRTAHPVRSARYQQRFREIVESSQKLRTYVDLRDELMAIWERSTRSSEQLLSQLQEWCRHGAAAPSTVAATHSWNSR